MERHRILGFSKPFPRKRRRDEKKKILSVPVQARNCRGRCSGVCRGWTKSASRTAGRFCVSRKPALCSPSLQLTSRFLPHVVVQLRNGRAKFFLDAHFGSLAPLLPTNSTHQHQHQVTGRPHQAQQQNLAFRNDQRHCSTASSKHGFRDLVTAVCQHSLDQLPRHPLP